MKRDLVGRFHERKHAPGRRMKLAVIRVVGTLKTTNSRTISLVPIVVRSRKRWGISDDRREIFSVDMLRVNHAHVIQVLPEGKLRVKGRVGCVAVYKLRIRDLRLETERHSRDPSFGSAHGSPSPAPIWQVHRIRNGYSIVRMRGGAMDDVPNMEIPT